ncbi:unnamed protein product [Zymoseptoria tritici ST99CH_1A5]|uniref:Rhodopsin domain-containing protein n=1 Tax=Zymoseptoria tritici ST99CH_1A5 TaxID=1276529 RepID=A0A1Y6LKC3_ZYMTR|nr:unnamed protein product [Zymoseptoria tritici ST99CH_1A5]
MRPSLCLWAVGALAISHVQAEYTLNSTAAMELPKCVTDCGLTVLPKMNCTLGADCYCARGGPVAIALTACVMAACPSLREPIQGLKFQADGCHWPRDRDLSTAALTVNVALFAFTTLFLTARLASRMPRWSGAGFSWDDGVASLCYVPIVGICVVGVNMYHYGLGRDMWMVPTDSILAWSKWFFASMPLYFVAAFCTKLSLILLYLRIWPDDTGTNRIFRMGCKVIGLLLLLTALISVLTLIFGCNPISDAWRYANRAGGKCIDRVAAGYAFGGLNVIFDLIVILLPIPRMIALKVSMRQRIGVVSCFLIGLVVTVCSTVRLTHLYQLTNVRDITMDFYPFLMWSVVEVYVSMICCCMPAMAGLLKRCVSHVANSSSIISSRNRIHSFDLVRPEKSMNKGSQYSEEYVGMGSLPPVSKRSMG